MASIKYVGRATSFEGKRLFDILCRLKDFGKGRVVYRNTFHKRYEEPCYYVITGVDPDMRDPTQKDQMFADKQVKSVARGVQVFRGENRGEREIRATFKADWRLVPKAEEPAFLSRAPANERPRNIVPSHVAFPPLLAHMVRQDLTAKGQDVSIVDQGLRIRIQQHKDSRAIQEGAPR